MAKFIDIVLRAKDFFSAKTDKAAESIGSLKTELNGLDKELKEVESQQAAIQVFRELSTESKALAQGVDEAQASLRGYAQQQAKASGEISEAEQAYKELKAQVAALNSSYSAQTKTLAASNNSLDKATATANKYGDAVSRNKLSIEKTNKEYVAQKAVFDQLEKKYKSTKAPLDKLSESYKNAKGQLTALEQVQKSQLIALTKSEASYQAAKDDLAGLEKTQRSYAKALDSTKAALKENTRLQAEAVAKQKAANLELKDVAANYKAAAKAIQVLSARLAKASADLAKANSKLESAGIDVNNLADATDKLSNKQKKLISATQKAASTLSSLTVKLKGVKSALYKAGAGVAGFTGRLAALAGTYIGIRGLTNSLVSFIQVGAKFEVFRKQFEGIMGSVAQGEQAFQWVKDFARETPLDMEQTTQAFVMLKGAGLDPMDGTLRALTDSTAKYTGGTAKLANITRQLSQAWAKGRINADDMRIAVDNGLPAWVLLSKATGKTVGQLRNLSEAGKLGRYELKLLFQELGNDAMGSAAKLMGTFNGQLAVAKFNIQEFLDQVAQSGALDFLTEKLISLNAQVKEMAADGSLKIFAKQLSDDFVVMAKNISALVTSVAKDLPEFTRKVNFSFGFLSASVNAFTGIVRFAIGSVSALFKVFALGAEKLTSAFGLLPNAVSNALHEVALFAKGMEDIATEQAAQDLKEFNLALERMEKSSQAAGAGLKGVAGKIDGIAGSADKAKPALTSLSDLISGSAKEARGAAIDFLKLGKDISLAFEDNDQAKDYLNSLIDVLETDRSVGAQLLIQQLKSVALQFGATDAAGGKVVKTLADLELEFESVGGKTLTNLQENVEKTVTVFNRFSEAKKPISELRQAFEQQLDAQLALAQAQNDYVLPANLAQQASVLGLSASYDAASVKLDKHNESLNQSVGFITRVDEAHLNVARRVNLSAEAQQKLGSASTLTTEQIKAQIAAAKSNGLAIEAASRKAAKQILLLKEQSSASGKLTRAINQNASAIAKAERYLQKNILASKSTAEIDKKLIRLYKEKTQLTDKQTKANEELTKSTELLNTKYGEGLVKVLAYKTELAQLELKWKSGTLGITEYTNAKDLLNRQINLLLPSLTAEQKLLIGTIDSTLRVIKLKKDLENLNNKGKDTTQQQTEAQEELNKANAEAENHAGANVAFQKLWNEAKERSLQLYDLTAVSVDNLTERTKALGTELANAFRSQSWSNILKPINDLNNAAKQNEIQAIAQEKAYRSLFAELERGAFSVKQLEELSRRAGESFDQLDNTRLDALQNQIQMAKDATRELKNELVDTLTDLQNELDQLEGNQQAVIRRNYEADKKELETKLAQARKSGDAKAIDDAREALAIQQEIFKLKVADAKVETVNTTKKVTENTNTNTNIKEVRQVQDIRYTVTFKAGNTSATFNEGGKNVEQLLQYLQDAGLTVTRG